MAEMFSLVFYFYLLSAFLGTELLFLFTHCFLLYLSQSSASGADAKFSCDLTGDFVA